VTGAPVKFAGVGEKYDALEPFHPDRIVSRILGMGDVLTLIEKVEKTVDARKAQQMAEKLRRSEFTLEDFREQLRQLRKMGPLEQVMDMLPKVGPLAKLPKNPEVDEKQLTRIEAIINSMTAAERADHSLLNGQRRKRIARGSGTSVQEVNQVVRQYQEMRRLFRQYGSLARMGRLRGLGKLAGLG
jgi:signal recognition particle subunit SRP54